MKAAAGAKRSRKKKSEPAPESEPREASGAGERTGEAGTEGSGRNDPSALPEAKRAKILKRVESLIALAAHEGTREEEARTSALVAVRLISTEKLLAQIPPPAHPLLDRLKGLGDETLDELGGYVEAYLAMGQSTAKGMTPQAVRWRNEAKQLQERLDAFVGCLHWILRGYKIDLVDRPGFCATCQRAFRLGDIYVWKRRRVDAMHYSCCIYTLQQQGTIPSAS